MHKWQVSFIQHFYNMCYLTISAEVLDDFKVRRRSGWCWLYSSQTAKLYQTAGADHLPSCHAQMNVYGAGQTWAATILRLSWETSAKPMSAQADQRCMRMKPLDITNELQLHLNVSKHEATGVCLGDRIYLTWSFPNPNQVVFEPKPEELITSHCNITRYLWFSQKCKANTYSLLNQISLICFEAFYLFIFQECHINKNVLKTVDIFAMLFSLLCMSKTIHNTVKYKDPLCSIVF